MGWVASVVMVRCKMSVRLRSKSSKAITSENLVRTR